MLNLKGTDEFLVQLSRWPFEHEVGGEEHNPIAHLVGQWWCSSGISIFCHLLTGGHWGLFPSFECTGDLVSVGMRGRVYHFRPLEILRLGVSSIVSIEGSHTGPGGYRVIVSVLSHGEQVYPIVLFLVDLWLEVCFDNLVDSFGLSISLGVDGHGHAGANSCYRQEVLLGIGCEPGITIGHDVLG